jgi:hypothetical protein
MSSISEGFVLRKVTSFAATVGLILATIANLPHSVSAANRGGPDYTISSVERGRAGSGLMGAVGGTASAVANIAGGCGALYRWP